MRSLADIADEPARHAVGIEPLLLLRREIRQTAKGPPFRDPASGRGPGSFNGVGAEAGSGHAGRRGTRTGGKGGQGGRKGASPAAEAGGRESTAQSDQGRLGGTRAG